MSSSKDTVAVWDKLAGISVKHQTHATVTM